jgi:hypothetical protein
MSPTNSKKRANMDNIEKIRTLSRRFKRLCTVLLWLIPLSLAAYWLFFNQLPEMVVAESFAAYVSRTQPLYVRVLAFLAGMIPAGALMYAVSGLRRLFELYMEGRIFSGENVRSFRRIGYALIWWAGASFLHTPISSVLMTLVNDPGKHMLALSISSDQALSLLLGGVVLLVSWVMDEGRKLEEERSLTI